MAGSSTRSIHYVVRVWYELGICHQILQRVRHVLYLIPKIIEWQKKMNEIWVYSSGWMRMMAKTKALGEKPVPVPLVHHKSHMDWPGIKATPLWQNCLTACTQYWPAKENGILQMDVKCIWIVTLTLMNTECSVLVSCFQMITHRMLVTGPWITSWVYQFNNPNDPKVMVWSAWWRDCGSALLHMERGPTDIWEDNLHTSTIWRMEYFFSSVRWLLPYRTVDRSTL